MKKQAKMNNKKWKSILSFIVAVAFLFSILVFTVGTCHNDSLTRKFQSLIDQVDTGLYISHHAGKNEACIEGYVGENRHFLHMYEETLDINGRPRVYTVVQISCPDIDEKQNFTIAVRRFSTVKRGPGVELLIKDPIFDEKYRLYSNSKEYLKRVLVPEIRQKLIKANKIHNGSFILSKQILKYRVYGALHESDIEEFKQAIEIETLIIEWMHDMERQNN